MTSSSGIAFITYLVCVSATAMTLTYSMRQLREPCLPGLGPAVVLTIGFALFFGGLTYPGVLAIILSTPLMSAVNGSLLLAPILIFSLFMLFQNNVIISLNKTAAKSETPWFNGLCLSTKITIVVGILTLLALVVLLLLGFPRGFEVSAYHLPIAVNIFRDGSLSVWDSTYMHAFPANMSVWNGLWLRVLPERLVSIVNLPFLLILVYAVFLLARQVGSGLNGAILVAIGIASVPIFGFSAIELGSDVGSIAFLVLAVVLALAGSKRDYVLAFVSGLAAGIAFGFKSLHLIGSALLGMLVLVGFARRAEAGARPWSSMDYGRALSYASGFALLAAPWLIRNWWELKNPLYPIHFGALSDTLGFATAPDFSLAERAVTQFEWVRSPTEWFVYPWLEWQFINQNFKHSSGLGAFFAATVPVAWLAWLMVICLSFWRDFNSSQSRFIHIIWPGLICFLIATGIFAVWALLADRQPRYVMGGIPLLMVLYGALLNWARPKWKQMGSFALSAAAAVMLSILVTSFAARQAGYLDSFKLPLRSDYYEYPSELDNLPGGAVIANLGGRPWHYPLYGVNLSNRIVPSTTMDNMVKEGRWVITFDDIHRFGITHFFTEGAIKADPSSCGGLSEVGGLRTNRQSGLPLPLARILYRIDGHCTEGKIILERVNNTSKEEDGKELSER